MNPHNGCTKIAHKIGNRLARWKCRYCGDEGTLGQLMGPNQRASCAYVYPPCRYCGQTPTCARDCRGIAEVLSTPDVHIVGNRAVGNA